ARELRGAEGHAGPASPRRGGDRRGGSRNDQLPARLARPNGFRGPYCDGSSRKDRRMRRWTSWAAATALSIAGSAASAHEGSTSYLTLDARASDGAVAGR